MTLDAGCGRGGPLMCGGFTTGGKLVDVIAVGGPGILETAPFEREAANDMHVANDTMDEGEVVYPVSVPPAYAAWA